MFNSEFLPTSFDFKYDEDNKRSEIILPSGESLFKERDPPNKALLYLYDTEYSKTKDKSIFKGFKSLLTKTLTKFYSKDEVRELIRELKTAYTNYTYENLSDIDSLKIKGTDVDLDKDELLSYVRTNLKLSEPSVTYMDEDVILMRLNSNNKIYL